MSKFIFVPQNPNKGTAKKKPNKATKKVKRSQSRIKKVKSWKKTRR